MPTGRALTPEERGRILGLHEAGLSIRAIAKRVECSVGAASNVIARPKKKLEKTRGRRPKLTMRDVRHVVREAAKGNETAAQIKAHLELQCSVRSVQRLLSRVDFLVYAKMVRTLALSPAHKEARLAWAKEAVLSPSAWSKMIFSDEKKFNLDGPDGYKYYWRDLRRPPRNFVQRQFGGGSVMVWGAFSAKGLSELAILRGKQASAHYVWTVSEYMLPFAHRHYGTDFLYQQDNASIHVSHETRAFFVENQIDVIPWPARSPDLNPIENLWAILSSKVYANGKQYESVEELTDSILREWKAIRMEHLHHLVESMPHRCIAVIEHKGGKIDY